MGPEERRKFYAFIENVYLEIEQASKEMVYFPPQAMVKRWILDRRLSDEDEFSALPGLDAQASRELMRASRDLVNMSRDDYYQDAAGGAENQTMPHNGGLVAGDASTAIERIEKAMATLDATLTRAFEGGIKRAEDAMEGRRLRAERIKKERRDARREQVRAARRAGANVDEDLQGLLDEEEGGEFESDEESGVSWDLLEGMEADGAQYLDDPDPHAYLRDATRILRQCYYRQNLYVHTAQYCDFMDYSRMLLPIACLTAVSSILSLLSASSAMGNKGNISALLASVFSFSCIVLTKIRGSKEFGKFDVKAEMARTAAGQYRILGEKTSFPSTKCRSTYLPSCLPACLHACLQFVRLLIQGESPTNILLNKTKKATTLEHRLRVHRHAVEGAAKDKTLAADLEVEKQKFAIMVYTEVRKVQDDAHRREEQCTIVHDPNDRAVSAWWLAGWLDPSRSDQPERPAEEEENAQAAKAAAAKAAHGRGGAAGGAKVEDMFDHEKYLEKVKHYKRTGKKMDPGIKKSDVQAALFLSNPDERRRTLMRRRNRSSINVGGGVEGDSLPYHTSFSPAQQEKLMEVI